jgi:hypothetical protein
MTVVTDNFNRSNEDLETSANWTEDQGDWEIISNQVEMVNVGGEGQNSYFKARWAGAALAGNDNYCELVVSVDGSVTIGASVRNSADTDVDCYAGMGWSGDTWYLLDLNNGVENVLGTWGSPSGGETVRVEAEGTTIRLLIDGTQRVSTTDSSYSSGVPGLCSYLNGIDGDDWEAGDISAGATLFIALDSTDVSNWQQGVKIVTP